MISFERRSDGGLPFGGAQMTLRFCFIYEWGMDKCDWRCDAVDVWTRVKVRHVREEGLMFQGRCHSRVNQTSVGRKGVFSLNTSLVAGEFATQDMTRPDKINLRFELHRGRTSKRWMVRQSYIWMWWEAEGGPDSPDLSSARVSYIISQVWELAGSHRVQE